MKKIVIVLISILFLISCKGTTKSIYVTNIKIVDVVNGNILNDQVILIEDGLIQSISKQIPEIIENDDSFNGNGMYVTPGLSDMNVFLDSKMMDREYWAVHPGDQMLAAGITTIRLRNYFKDPRELIEFEKEIRGNLTKGPDIIKPTVANYTSGKNIENLISEIEYAEADFINMLNYIAPDQMNNILNYAEEQNIYTNGNIFSFDDFLRCSELGFDELEKIDRINILLMDKDFLNTIDWFDENDFWKKYDQYYSKFYSLGDDEIEKEIEQSLNQIIEIMNENDIAVTTALFVDEISALKITNYDEYFKYAEKYNIPERVDSIYLYTKTVLGDHFRLEMIPDYVKFKPNLNRIILKKLKENDVLILAGTSFASSAWYGIAPGISLNDEFNILLESGFTNLEVLQTATLNPSKIGEKMGLEEKWGIIDAGYRADLIFTKDNPLESIKNLREPEYVMKSGEMYSIEDLKSHM